MHGRRVPYQRPAPDGSFRALSVGNRFLLIDRLERFSTMSRLCTERSPQRMVPHNADGRAGST